MVETLGHFGMALIFLAPAWLFIDQKRTAAVSVVGIAANASLAYRTIRHTGHGV